MNDLSSSSTDTAYLRRKRRLEEDWREFISEFPDPKDALDRIFNTLRETGSLRCPNCYDSDFERDRGERVGRCNSCGKSIWIFASTFFHGMRTSTAQAWLWAILLKEQGELFSSSMFHEIAGIAQSTAYVIIKKIEMVQARNLPKSTDLTSARFVRLFTKRSRETPARAHPSEEEETVESAHSSNEAFDFNFSGYASAHDSDPESDDCNVERVFDCFESKAISHDEICRMTNLPAGEVSTALTKLLLLGSIKNAAGDRFVRQLPEPRELSDENNLEDIITSAIKDFADVTIEHFHGISRKYLQLYLAAYASFLNSSISA